MSNYTSGQKAEIIASEYLITLGFTIVHKNWKTSWCEIDIVASKENVLYFVEVKYRATNSFGSGFEYITHKKQRQMARAAEGYVQQTKWRGDYSLSAIEVSGEDFTVTNFIAELI